MTSVVLVDTGGKVVEYVTAEEEPQQVGQTQATAVHKIILPSFLISVLFSY